MTGKSGECADSELYLVPGRRFDVSVNEFIAQTLTQKERVDLGLVGLVFRRQDLLTGGLHQESRVIMEEKRNIDRRNKDG